MTTGNGGKETSGGVMGVLNVFFRKTLRSMMSDAVARIEWCFANRKVVVTFVTLAVLLAVLRRPDALLNPQFWAEDGTIWFTDAYNRGGFVSLADPVSGYFQTVSRLAAWIALSVPLQFAPLVTNVIALTIHVLPILLLWSSRWSSICPSSTIRILVTLWYVALPATREIYGNVTNAHWILALYALMILVAKEPKSVLGRIHDVFFVALSSLSGPFSVFMFPVSLYILWKRRRERSKFLLVLFAILLLGAVVQLSSILFSVSTDRIQNNEGFSLGILTRLVAAKMFGVLLLGKGTLKDVFHNAWIAYPLFTFGLACISYAIVRGTVFVRALVSFAFLLLAFALKSPMVSPTGNQWAVMGNDTTAGSRYFVIPLIAAIAVFVWILSRMWIQKRMTYAVFFSALIIMAMIHGFSDYQLKKYKDFHWRDGVEKFHSLPSESVIDIPINPGPGWSVHLKK